MGMGGVLFPNSQFIRWNPTYGIIPSAGYSLPLPLGILSIVRGLSVAGLPYGQGSLPFDHFLNVGLFKTSTVGSPIQDLSSLGALRDALGTGFLNNWQGTLFLIPDIRIGIPVAEFSIGLGFYSRVNQIALRSNAALLRYFETGVVQANTLYELGLDATFDFGFGFDFLWHRQLETPVPVTIAVRPQAEVTLLEYGIVQTSSAQSNAAGNFSGTPQPPKAIGRAVSPFVGGFGLKLGLDLGVRAELNQVFTQSDQLEIGLGISNLLQYRYESGQINNLINSNTPIFYSNNRFIFQPTITLSGSYRMADSIILADMQFTLGGRFNTHLGAEYQLGIWALRGGIGLDNGLRFGIGAGVDLGGFGFDLAITSQQVLFTNTRDFGVAFGLRFR